MSRTYGKLKLSSDGEVWIIESCEPHVAIRLKHIFPRISKGDKPPYMIPNTPAFSADIAWFLQRYPLAANDDDVAELGRRREIFAINQAEMERILVPDYQPPARVGLRGGQSIRPYQAQAVEMLSRCSGLLLGDDVGLGKTYTAGGACLIEGALPAIIVCQGHLQSQWVRVLTSLLTLTVMPIHKTRPYSLPPADVYVMRYTQLQGWGHYLSEMRPGLIAFDEMQELRRGEDSEKGKGAAAICGVARYRLGLTATPIYNYGTEIWKILQYLRPDVLGPYWDFFREWCPTGHIVDPAALGTFLREQYAFLRRTKRDVGQQMPAVNRIVEKVDTDGAELKSVEELARDLAIRATTGEFTERGRAVRELDLRVRQATGVDKAKAVAAYARIIVESGSPIVLVGWHREVYDIWNAELRDLRPAMYTGTETSKQKDEAKRRFVDGETDILILSLRSGAGLDGLQYRCSTMLFGELDWSPGVHVQCIGRLDREGQQDPVTAIFLVVDDGSDPPMMEVLGLKASEAAHIIDPGTGLQSTHTDASHVQTLVKRYLSRRKDGAARPANDLNPKAQTEQETLL